MSSWAQETYNLKYRLISAATTNATVFNAAQTRLGRFTASNTGATVAFVKIYDKATAPVVGTDIPVATLCVPGLTTGTFVTCLLGFPLKLGFGIAITGVGTDADATAVGLAQVIVNFTAQ